jgi:hypothetical protein
MAQLQRDRSVQKEGRLALAAYAIQRNTAPSFCRAAKLCDISKSTLWRRVSRGTPTQAQSNQRKRKLQPAEEQSLVDWILSLDQNICSGFLSAGLIPYDPDRVLSSLPAVKTPSPPSTAVGSSAPTWTSETPRNTAQLEQQARLIKSLLQRTSQSPTSQAVNQLIKGCQLAINSAVLLATENEKLRQANQRKKKKQEQRRRYIAQGGVLTGQEGQDLVRIAENAEEGGVQSGAAEARQRAPPTCSNCHIQGHNRRQCRVGRESGI